MARDPEGVVTFEAAGEKFSAVFGFKAMKSVEAHYDKPFFEAMQQAFPALSAEDAADPDKVAAAGASIRLTEVGKIFEFSLMKHHPELTEDDIDDMVDDLGLERVGEIIAEALASAMEQEGGAKSAGNPPKRRRKQTG